MTAPKSNLKRSHVVPLADRIRPQKLEQFHGQQHLLTAGKPLHEAIVNNRLHSMLFWGPPGTGKTTLARLIAAYCDTHFITMSAVLSGVKDIRQSVALAREKLQQDGRTTLLFVDEAHRFNKSQQDAFLPHIEDGTIYFIGATTENPSFELNNALLSRVRTYVLKPLTEQDIAIIVTQALEDEERGLGVFSLQIEPDALNLLSKLADGDARRALNLLEMTADLVEGNTITRALIGQVAGDGNRRFDKGGDQFYEQISALHKSVRGSNPDAALYWLCRMLDGGCDPGYVARRMVRMASEDIGNADPRALTMCIDAWEIYLRLGSPEGELAIAQGIIYLACAPKSNAVYSAYSAAMNDARNSGSLEVPLHLRNAPTSMMRELGYGKEYRYAHDEEDAYVAGENYFPEKLGKREYYFPIDRGLEIKIKAKLVELKKRDRKIR